jgi:hypothetical protein
MREKRDVELARLKSKYETRLQTLTDQLRRANERVEREQAQSGQQKMNAALSVGATLLGALFGRKLTSMGNVGRAMTAMKSAGRIGKEAAALQSDIDPAQVDVQKTPVRPRKSDISVGTLGLCWIPGRRDEDGTLIPA